MMTTAAYETANCADATHVPGRLKMRDMIKRERQMRDMKIMQVKLNLRLLIGCHSLQMPKEGVAISVRHLHALT